MQRSAVSGQRSAVSSEGSPKGGAYGADYPDPGVEAKNQRLSAPNAPYVTTHF
ncbi:MULTISPECIES: hypothetical protein [Moorena]|uniref:hypothetical protein n=1 Tax=Moorena TaxID=1155738 RepID=UPI0012B618C0|nr:MULTISPECIES: hypothetical protein [Moorena]NEQ15441.1 hypothetical protein [Moorena sp. SIO3E2]NEP36338.1 hypothetical protein [Moorena sp. SIO3B2]NEQ08598.1 hypothetical protein [Moorena sp. SIO4E2]NER91219.1 hypothetical protein [Moorena sp. SIO3A2]NES44524.1 hypothetical protein [Moorena sp. SIO2C4]